MPGKKRDRYQVWFPGKNEWELWFIAENREAVLAGTCRHLSDLAFSPGRGCRVFAIPARYLDCRTFLSSATDEKELCQSAHFHLSQLENIDGDIDGPGLQPVAGSPPQTLTRIDVLRDSSIVSTLPSNLKPQLFVPAAALLPMPRQGVGFWKELGDTVAGLERNGLLLSYRVCPTSPTSTAGESVGQWIAQLIEERKTGRLQEVHSWDPEINRWLLDELPGSLRELPRPAPAGLHSCIPIRPRLIRKLETKKKVRLKRRYQILAAALSVAAVILLCHALMVLSDRIILDQQETIAQLNEEARKVQDYRAQWREVAPAVDCDASVLEIWRSLVSMPTTRSVKVKRMALSQQAISLTCQAESRQHALRFVDQITKDDNLSAYHWDYSTPEIRLDGTALFEAWGEKSTVSRP